MKFTKLYQFINFNFNLLMESNFYSESNSIIIIIIIKTNFNINSNFTSYFVKANNISYYLVIIDIHFLEMLIS